MSARGDAIASWLRERVAASSTRGFVVGLSGGVDSAVVIRLCQMAAGESVVGVMLPCHSDPQDDIDARLVADHFGVRTLRLDLAPAYDRLVADLGAATAHLTELHVVAGSPDIAARLPLANIKPRLRMASLYFVANSLNYLVAGTGNRSELTIGYFTKHGDGGCDVLPIGRLLKSEVRALAAELGVPQPVIDKAPSAGLWLGQTDESEMGFTYAQLEDYLTNGAGAVPRAVAQRIEMLVRQSDHKRAVAQMP